MRFGRLFTIVLGSLAGGFASAQESDIRSVAIVNVAVVDIDQQTVSQPQTVLIEDGLISAVAPTGEIAFDEEMIIVPGAGLFLMPGLTDMHAHYNYEGDGVLYLSNGVTTVRQPWGNSESFKRDSLAKAGRLAGPHVYASGTTIDGAEPMNNNTLAIASPDAARAAVASQSATGFRAIKLYETLDAETYRAAVDEARSRGMQIWSHTPRSMRVEDLLELRVDSIEHLDGYQFSMTTEEIDFSGIHTFGFLYAGWKQTDPTLMARLAQETVSAGVWNAPTLTVYTQLYEYAAEGEAFFARDEARYIHPDDMEYWRSSQDLIISLLDGARAAREPMFEFVGMLHEAGAGLLVGTDTPNPFLLPGFSLHDELANLASTGISNGDVLRMATVDAARFLGEPDVFGLVDVGMRADLILVEGNPLEDLSVLKDPAYVVVGGNLWDQAVLRDRREEVAARRQARQ